MDTERGDVGGVREAGDEDLGSALAVNFGDGADGARPKQRRVDVRMAGASSQALEGGAAVQPIAFITPMTPAERAWADLCDEKENADVERIVAATGGWGEWIEGRLTYRAFSAAFNGDTSLLLVERAQNIQAVAAKLKGGAQ
jgi:hypothetical protein